MFAHCTNVVFFSTCLNAKATIWVFCHLADVSVLCPSSLATASHLTMQYSLMFHSVILLDAGWPGQEGGFNFELAGYPTPEPFRIGSSLVVTSCFDLCVLCDITDATLLHVCPHRSDYMAPIGQLMMAIGPRH